MNKHDGPRLGLLNPTVPVVSVAGGPALPTERTLADLAIPVARRLAFVLVLFAGGAALAATGLGLLATGHAQEKSFAPLAVTLIFGGLLMAAAFVCHLVFNSRKTLRRPAHIWPPKTPETVPDAWLGTGIMAAISLAILVLAAAFGGDSWADRASSVAALLPLALLGPGIVSGIFLITGYTVGHSDAVFHRWLAKRPAAQAEYAELVAQVRGPRLP